LDEAIIIQRFLRVADRPEARHPHYAHTVAVAALCRTLVTGEGMDALMKRFARRESAALFKQRVEITQHIVKPVVENILDVFRKVPRSNYRREVAYANSEASKPQELEKLLKKFWGDKTVDDWCALRLLELNATDPNAWAVLEWQDFDNRTERASPYPFEVSSANALDYKYQRGELLYLIARSATATPEGKPLDRLTLYLPNRSVSLTEVPKEQQGINDGLLTLAAKKYFLEEHLPHGLGYVPAFRIGYKRDMVTEGNTFVAPYDAAIPLLRKTIKANSELDLVMALQAFPLTLRYAEACDAQGCLNGHVNGTDKVCGDCGGTGKKRPTSAQEEIVVSLPTSPEGLFDLEKLVAFKAPDVAIIQFQQQYVEAKTREAKAVVFNSDIFSRKEIADTATSKNIDLQSVYDTLYPYARQFASAWEFAVRGTAQIAGLDSGLTAQLLIKRDFKLKSLDDLLAELNTVTSSGAGPAIRRNVQADIARAMMVDEPQEFVRWSVREQYNPFSGMSEAEVMYLLGSDLVPRTKKVLYANLGSIFDALESEVPGFYELEGKKQAALVTAKAAEIEAATAPASPSLLGDTVGGGGDTLGKVPLAVQQLALSRQRAIEAGDTALAAELGKKMDELLEKI